MGFGIGLHTQKPDQGEMRQKPEDIACGCWFTSQGRAIPKLIKYKDQEEKIHCVSEIEVLYAQKQNFCGIPTMMYSCRTVLNGQEYRFRLFFYQEDYTWKIVWESPGTKGGVNLERQTEDP